MPLKGFCMYFALLGLMQTTTSVVVMIPSPRTPAFAFPAHGEKQAAAASGRRRRFAFTAAVEKTEDQRKPEGFFGYRKADRWHPPIPREADDG